MMTEQELCERQRKNGNSEMYLQLKGNFWRAYDGGAFALSRITGYQVRKLKTIDRYVLGFPERALDRVLALMEKNGMTVQEHGDDATLIAFSGGDATMDQSLVTSENTGIELPDTTADYRHLCNLRKELLNINLADETLTLNSLIGTVRNLQILCLSHLAV